MVPARIQLETSALHAVLKQLQDQLELMHMKRKGQSARPESQIRSAAEAVLWHGAPTVLRYRNRTCITASWRSGDLRELESPLLHPKFQSCAITFAEALRPCPLN